MCGRKKKGERIMFIDSHVSIPLKYLYFINFRFNSLNEQYINNVNKHLHFQKFNSFLWNLRFSKHTNSLPASSFISETVLYFIINQRRHGCVLRLHISSVLDCSIHMMVIDYIIQNMLSYAQSSPIFYSCSDLTDPRKKPFLGTAELTE